MKKILLPLAFSLTLSQAFAGVCAKPNEYAASAFKTIETGGDLATYLQKYTVARTALNEDCEDMYMLALKTRNEAARAVLDRIGYGPKKKEDYLSRKDNSYDSSYLIYALKYATVPVIKDFISKAGEDAKYLLSSVYAAQSNTLDVIQWAIAQWGGQDQAFVNAVYSNSKQVIDGMIRDGANVNQLGVLSYAILRGDSQIMELLIRAGLDLNQKISDEFPTAVDYAARFSSHEVIKLLVDSGATAPTLNSLALSFYNKDPRAFNKMLELGVNPKEKWNNGVTLLMKAAEASNLQAIQRLVQLGLNIHDEDKNGMTALFYAGSAEMVKLLVSLGSDIHKKNAYGNTALILSAGEGSLEVTKSLIEMGSDPNTLNNNGENALISFIGSKRCTTASDIDIVKTLLEAKTFVNQKDSKGYTALIKLALITGCDSSPVMRDPAIMLLLKYGANKDIKVYSAYQGKKVRAYNLYLNASGRNSEVLEALK